MALSDPNHERYVISEAAWNANLPILRRVRLEGVPALQDSYAAARKLRSDYDVVCASVLAYLDALHTLFDRKVGVNAETLSAVLSQERQSLALATVYGTSLADVMERMKALQATLERSAHVSVVLASRNQS